MRLLTVELPEILSITGTVHAATLEALAAVLLGAMCSMTSRSATPDESPAPSPSRPIHAGWMMTAAAAAVTDRAIAVHLDRGANFDNRMAAGLALHRTAAVQQADDE